MTLKILSEFIFSLFVQHPHHASHVVVLLVEVNISYLYPKIYNLYTRTHARTHIYTHTHTHTHTRTHTHTHTHVYLETILYS